MDFAMEKHGMLASDFFVFCQESVTAQERYGKYEDEDEHSEQSKLNQGPLPPLVCGSETFERWRCLI